METENSDYDDKYMEIAFEQAREALEAGEVPIGCCFVNNDGDVIDSDCFTED